MSFQNFIQILSTKLQDPLPGYDAHVKMMAEWRINPSIQPNASTRKSAILVLFYPDKNNIFVPLILRPMYDGVHGGQMAFPGGQKEKSDENLIRTALRETQEEIGIKAIDVNIIGVLSEIFIPPSNFTCLPVVGYINYKPTFYPDAKEVDKVFEIKIEEFLDEKNLSKTLIKNKNFEFETPCYVIQDKIIWGATAIMIVELLEIIKR